VDARPIVDLHLSQGVILMNKLLSTTALVLALGLPTFALAQSTTPAADPAAQSENGDMQGFLSARSQSDILASELMGQDVFARRTPEDSSDTAAQSDSANEGNQRGATMTRADIDQMDNIGQVNEIVLSQDGDVRAVVIGVGGFLGIGQQDVAVTMDQITIGYDQDDRSQMHVVVNFSAEMLKQSPRYDRTAAVDDGTAAPQDTAENQRTALSRPAMAREGYDQLEATQVSSEMLIGKTVYDVSDDSVGTVDDLIMDDSGEVTNVIIDFGGFLGMASSQVSLRFDELTILTTANNDDVRVYVDATKEQIQNLPQYEQAQN